MTHLTNDQVVNEAKERTPKAVAVIDKIDDYGCFPASDFEETVKKDVLKLRSEAALEGMQILGFTMDLGDGVVRQLHV